MLNKETSLSIIKKLIAGTKFYAAVNIGTDDVRLTRFADSEIHQNVEIEEASAVLTLYDGKKEISCQTNDLSDEGLKKLIADAEEILPLIPEGTFEHPEPDSADIPDTKCDARLAANFGISQRADTVKRLIGQLPEGFSMSGVLSLDRFVSAYGNTDGAFKYCAFDEVSFETTITHKDGATGYGAVRTNSYDDCHIDNAFKTALKKAETGINPESIDLGAYTVILEPAATADLLTFICYGLNAKSVGDGMSYASGRIGEKVFGDNVTVWDDVSNPATPPLYFDFEGNTRKSLPLIENGVVKNILHDSKTARKAGVNSTGHAVSGSGNGGYPFNIVMEGGDSSLEEMIASTEKGLLVTHFHYTNYVNPKTAQVTGLTRDGLFMIENGKVTYPITTMRFTESMIDAFSHITEISKERSKIEIFTTSLIPAVKIEGFHFTSKQK